MLQCHISMLFVSCDYHGALSAFCPGFVFVIVAKDYDIHRCAPRKQALMYALLCGCFWVFFYVLQLPVASGLIVVDSVCHFKVL